MTPGERADGGGEDGAAGGASSCLRVEDGPVRVDERGFHGPVEIPWRDVRGVCARAETIEVQGRLPDRPGVAVFRTRVDPAKARMIEAAWRQQLVKALERGEPLRGTLRSGFRRVPVLLAILAVVMLLWAAGSCALSLSLFATAGETAPSARAAAVGAGAVALVAFVFSLGLCAHAVRYARLGRVWREWEYDIEGLKFWPHGAGSTRKVLRPLATDLISPRLAIIAGERVPLAWMTGYGILARLLLASGRLAEATLARDSLGEVVLVPALCVTLWIMVILTRAALPAHLPMQVIAFGAACAGTVAWMWGTARARRRFRKYFSDGRAMIEHLRW